VSTVPQAGRRVRCESNQCPLADSRSNRAKSDHDRRNRQELPRPGRDHRIRQLVELRLQLGDTADRRCYPSHSGRPFSGRHLVNPPAGKSTASAAPPQSRPAHASRPSDPAKAQTLAAAEDRDHQADRNPNPASAKASAATPGADPSSRLHAKPEPPPAECRSAEPLACAASLEFQFLHGLQVQRCFFTRPGGQIALSVS
jgi:hypothetical protein